MDKILREFIAVIEFVWISYHHRIVSVIYMYCYDNLYKEGNKNRTKQNKIPL